MNYLLTVSFANEKVAMKSYAQLVKTMKPSPCKVLLFDNHYPGHDARKTAEKFGFEYHSAGSNIGQYAAYNYLINELPADTTKILFYDGDHFPLTEGWHLAMLDVLSDPAVAHVSLKNDVTWREFEERPYDRALVFGNRVRVALQPMTNTMCGFTVEFLRLCGGVKGGHVYYGGNEIEMWKYYGGRKWVYLEDYEVQELKDMHDWQYEQYKLLYAQKGLDMSYEEYLNTNPEKQTIVI